jgi:putative hemolysin
MITGQTGRMKPPARIGLVLAWLLLPAACSTRVIDLVVPEAGAGAGPAADAGAEVAADGPLSCEMVRRADGTVCTLCFTPDGNVVKGACEPAAVVPPGDPGPGVPVCKVVPRGETRCRSCSGARSYTACLVCLAPFELGGEQCQSCSWDDAPDIRCLRCLAKDGTVTHDDCDATRKEVLSSGGV